MSPTERQGARFNYLPDWLSASRTHIRGFSRPFVPRDGEDTSVMWKRVPRRPRQSCALAQVPQLWQPDTGCCESSRAYLLSANFHDGNLGSGCCPICACQGELTADRGGFTSVASGRHAQCPILCTAESLGGSRHAPAGRAEQNQLPLLSYFSLLACNQGKIKGCRRSQKVILLQINWPEK